MKTVKWGILGIGNIAHKFVEALNSIDFAEIVAVGSRSMERADAFAKQYGIENAYGNYDGLVNNPEVEIIYVATTHPSHKDCVLMCLKAGKAVVCEKPFTINAKESEELIKYARQAKLFLMEAMWTRYLPAIKKVREIVDSKIIGEINLVKADFGFRCDWNPKSRILNPDLGGGALLDIGIYIISFASMVFKTQPIKISSMAHIGETGVDEEFSCILGYKEGKMAVLTGAIRTNTPHDAWIIGTKGRIFIPDFWHATSILIYLDGRDVEKLEIPTDSAEFSYEALEAMRCLREGMLESDIMPLDETLSIMQTMDQIRAQWGLKYPME